MMELPIRITDEELMPTKGTKDAACYDLRAARDTSIPPGESAIVGTGIYAAVPSGWALEILSRSGLASRGIVVGNSPGIVDSDYRGEIGIIIRNTTNHFVMVNRGDRIAQCRLAPTYPFEFRCRDNLDSTERGAGGFGHTGVK